MPSRDPATFQDVVLALQRYWADQGCVIWQPYYTQVGAGTMNPATFLRVLGPEPWRVAYVEPSIRPDDGRYGENPNRLQQHYQFQVILKPDPGDPQELYLRSLLALGIDPAEHDIRFVEDNWDSPALGAWGLGWEVWLDGQEITQFTYFQQAGGLALDPVSVEITYGLERILMALQQVGHFGDIRWSREFTYGELNLEGEREHSRYYFETADVERLWTMFNEFEAEARQALDLGLVLPAHDYILKCSHTFNVLDTRGAIGVTERAALFARMRDLSRRSAEAYLAQRQALGFPWKRPTTGPAQVAAPDAAPPPSAPAPFVLEVGTEELPAADLDRALQFLQEGFGPQVLEANHLRHQGVRTYGTPRRLVVSVAGLAPRQDDVSETVKGPPASAAFDAQGKPTAALLGWARKKGISEAQLGPGLVREVGGQRYVTAEIRLEGRPAADILSQALPAFLGGLRFEKAMRWDGDGLAFSRPIRWLLALHGEHIIPLTFAGLRSGRATRGLRFHEPEKLSVADAEAYFEALKAQGIVLEVAERRRAIAAQVRSLAAEVGGAVVEEQDLLDEVTNLVEAPTALRGTFDPEHLTLPRQVLVAVMKKHQRYFPVQADGRLLPYFIAVRNGGREHLEVVALGNELVLRARFADAAYFIRRDLKRPLQDYLPRLESLTFQAKLGSMLDKTHRIERLVRLLAGPVGLDPQASQVASRAAQLCKADLVTQMVVEMTSLQGEMGREYALRSGEPPAVADAILEHYLPRHSGDRLPASRAGLAVGLADRLDTLMGLFAAGLQPSGARDPFALRRAAIGLVQMLAAAGLRFDLRQALQLAAGGLPIPVSKSAEDDCLEFVLARQQALLLADGRRHDVVEAVLAAQGHDPAGAALAVAALEHAVAQAGWAETLQAYARCARITRGPADRKAFDPDLTAEAAERGLYAALRQAEGAPRLPGSVDGFLAAFRPMTPAITAFFEDVLVMAEDPAQRANRLALLQRIVALADGVADLSKLEGF